MIVTEVYRTRADGVVLIRTYSDAGYQIERDGVLYDEAIDPAHLNRTYTESTIPVENEELSEMEQKAHAYDIVMGVAE